jgi:hypothetical protein
LDDPQWQRTATVVLAACATASMSIAVGLLVRRVSADWLEAVGTWVGALTAVTAVILAYIIFRREEFTRRWERARQEQAELDAKRSTAQAVQRTGNMVRGFVSWIGYSTSGGEKGYRVTCSCPEP